MSRTSARVAARTANQGPPDEGGQQPPAGDNGPGGGPPPGGGGGGGPGDNLPPPPIPVNEPVPFGLTPGLAHQGIIDYNTKAGFALYKSATKPVSEVRYDCDPDEFYTFLQTCKNRALGFGWSDVGGILNVPINNNQNAPTLNLLEEYGQLSLERIKEHERGVIGQQSRAAQDDRMLYECLLNSISNEGKKQILLHRDQYIIDTNPGGANNQRLPSGLCLLKIIIRESHLDTNATTAMIRLKLSNLDSFMPTVGNDITKFNGYVKMLVDTLGSRGKHTEDLIINLFKGYGAVADKVFVEYMAKKQDEFDEGTDFTPQQLMQLADAKYRTMKEKKIWEAPSETEEKIMALEARLEKIKNQQKGWDKKRKSDSKGGGNPGKAPKKDQKGKPKKDTTKPKWMTQRPSDADLNKPRKWNGKDWHWCSKETGGKCDPGEYRRHTPAQCEGKAHKRGKDDGTKLGVQFAKKVTINEAVDTDDESVDFMGGYESE